MTSETHSRPFVATSGPKDEPWQKVPIKVNGEYEPYSPKLEEDLSRKRNTLKETDQREFDAFSK